MRLLTCYGVNMFATLFKGMELVYQSLYNQTAIAHKFFPICCATQAIVLTELIKAGLKKWLLHGSKQTNTLV